MQEKYCTASEKSNPTLYLQGRVISVILSICSIDLAILIMKLERQNVRSAGQYQLDTGHQETSTNAGLNIDSMLKRVRQRLAV